MKIRADASLTSKWDTLRGARMVTEAFAWGYPDSNSLLDRLVARSDNWKRCCRTTIEWNEIGNELLWAVVFPQTHCKVERVDDLPRWDTTRL